jgi:hypothetical protein
MYIYTVCVVIRLQAYCAIVTATTIVIVHKNFNKT